MTAQDILQQCTVTGKTVILPPGQLDRKLYLEVAKQLEMIGGQWNRKAQGFIFRQNPEELLEQLCNGATRN